MESLIIIIHVLAAIAVTVLVLLQRGKGAEMGASFGSGASQTLFGSTGSGNVLTKSTTVFAIIFFVTSLSLAVFARQSAAEQNRIFKTGGHRRIVLATNVAETSLTVPGIRYVIDPGYARVSRYSVRNKVQRLPIEKVSQSSANQRSGRCGRVAAGVAIRLYDENDFKDFCIAILSKDFTTMVAIKKLNSPDEYLKNYL